MSLYGAGETYNYGFGTYNASGALVNADSLPAATLVVNGTDTGATVTVTNAATGRYKVAASLAGRAVGDDCYVRFAATVGGVTQEGRTPTFRIAFPAALSGGVLTQGTGTAQVNASGGKVPSTLAAADLSGTPAVNVTQVNGTAVTTADGTAQAGGAGTITLASGDAAGANAYVDRVLTVVSGTGAGQSRTVTAYNSSTKVATVHRAWDTVPDATSQYAIDQSNAVADKAGYSLAASGLDAVVVTPPAGPASTFPQMVVQLWRRFFKRVVKDPTTLKTYADDGTTVVTTQNYTSGATDDLGAAG